jgi:hypothetical protein
MPNHEGRHFAALRLSLARSGLSFDGRTIGPCCPPSESEPSAGSWEAQRLGGRPQDCGVLAAIQELDDRERQRSESRRRLRRVWLLGRTS